MKKLNFDLSALNFKIFSLYIIKEKQIIENCIENTLSTHSYIYY